MQLHPTPVAGDGGRRLRGPARASTVLVWITVAGPLAVFASTATFGASASTATAQTGMVLLGGGLLVTYAGCTAAGVVAVVWLARARAAVAGTAHQRWSPGWVVAGWLVPVMNLWVPVEIVSDVVRGSAGGADPQADPLRPVVAAWWATWIGAWVALSAALVGTPLVVATAVGAVTVWFGLFAGLSALLFLAAAAAFTRIVGRVTERLVQRNTATLPPPPDHGGPAPTAGPEAPEPAVASPDPGPAVGGAGYASPPFPLFPPPPPFTPPPPSPARRTWLLVAVAGVAVLALVAVGVALVVADEPPADVVAAAVEDAREWDGARYRGTVQDLDGARVDVDITVTTRGARGTLVRDGGRAEVVRDAGGAVLLKGDRQWWARSQPERAELLADTWVAEPGTETLVIEEVLRLDPRELAQEVRPELASLWEVTGEQVVDGEPGIVISNGFQVLVVTADEPRRLLLVDLNSMDAHGDGPLRVFVVPASDADELAADIATIRATGSPRTLTDWLLLRPEADIQIQPEPVCATPTCSATFTVRNTGEIPIRGRFEMTADGRSAGTHPVDLRPGQSATFQATTPNRLYNSPGARGEIRWEGVIVPG